MALLDGRSVLFVVAHRGFRDEELLLPRGAVLAEGARVALASSSLAPASGMLGAEAPVDLLYSAARARDHDALVFVGGSGATEYFHDRTAHRLVRDAVEAGKVVGGICYGASVLAEAGVLRGKRATAFPTRRDHLVACGASYTGEPVVRDGNVVTARDPEAAVEFGRALVEALAGLRRESR